MLANLGIHYCLIPKSMGIDYLESPIAMLDRTLAQCFVDKENYFARQGAAIAEAEMFNSIEVTDD